MSDISKSLIQQVMDACDRRQALSVQGNNSKAFYGNAGTGEAVKMAAHNGIISYEPTELVITARAGTPLADINHALAEQNQMLAFEPPAFSDATLGGTIACNLSGPRRPYAGAARDAVLGCRIINGKGEMLHFGGEVMKNVAGYDVSRLMTGAMGTLGVLLDISVKVLPRPQDETSLRLETNAQQAQDLLAQWRSRPLPVSAACHVGNSLFVRLSGDPSAITAAHAKMGGELLQDSETFWQSIREQEHAFFDKSLPLWRLSLPPSANINLEGEILTDWGGAQRWLFSEQDAEQIRNDVKLAGGHATLYKNGTGDTEYFHPLESNMLNIQRRLKKAFDPENILNPGRMYKGL